MWLTNAWLSMPRLVAAAMLLGVSSMNSARSGTVPACAEAGILGALPGILGSMMALEVIREIVGFGEGLVGCLLMVDARSMRFETLNYAWDSGNPLSGENPTIKD